MDARTQKILQRIGELAQISETPEHLTRTFASPAMRAANELVAGWMRAAGMETNVDGIGNLIGRYASETPKAKILLLGSHLDTVGNAGKYDGPLGVILAIACVEEWQRQKIRPPFDIEVLGFADEEGVRYQTTYLGSKTVTGTFNPKDLDRLDSNGIPMREAIRAFGGDVERLALPRWPRGQIIGYLEAHIEQGPVLEKNKLPVGVVTSISGQSRLLIRFLGQAGHAGTTPMHLRADALCAAAEFILAVERQARKTKDLVATVGKIQAEPGAGNVIPGAAILTLDVRHQSDKIRRQAVATLRGLARQMAIRRQVKIKWQLVQQTASVPCSATLSQVLASAVKNHQARCLSLPSGAGHDAAVMANLAPTAMLFIRCKKGISHNPAESVKAGDVTVALKVMNDFIRQLAQAHE
jgi:allantoate deiminase